MVNILKKYFSEKTQSTEFQSIIDSYTKLKQMTNNFEELINGEQITLNDEIFESFYNFLFAYAKISNLVEKEDFLNEVEKICTSKEIIFWDSIVLYFETVSHIREQTKFLREMSVTDFQDLMNYTFSCHIMHNNFVKSYKSWSSVQVQNAKKTINTVLSSMIDDFFDFKTTILDFEIKFGFGEERYEFIWSLCRANKDYLMLKNITEQNNKILSLLKSDSNAD